MKTISNLIVAGSLLATVAAAQTQTASLFEHRRGLPNGVTTRSPRLPPWAGNSLMVYVTTLNFQFGAMDLRTGTFLPIGPGLPPDVGSGLVPGRGASLLTLAFSGNLDAIDPSTGVTSVVGATGLGDCSVLASYAPDCANAMGQNDGSLYATDFAQNLYSLNAHTGAAKLIGHTGIPPLTFGPFSQNPDGSVNVYSETLFSVRGKLYANFATLAVNFATGVTRTIISGALYHINTRTAHATWIASTDSNLTATTTVNDTVYAFDIATGQVVTLDVTNGHTCPVSEVDPAAGGVGGAAPARPGKAAGAGRD